MGPLVSEVRAGKFAKREGLSYLEAKHMLLLQVRVWLLSGSQHNTHKYTHLHAREREREREAVWSTDPVWLEGTCVFIPVCV